MRRGRAGAGDHRVFRELHERHGTRPISQAEFDERFGDVPGDGEG
ncbi:MAG: hypothetical protein ACR2LK_12075 [Solirubrobacteraceae bacterium]